MAPKLLEMQVRAVISPSFPVCSNVSFDRGGSSYSE